MVLARYPFFLAVAALMLSGCLGASASTSVPLALHGQDATLDLVCHAKFRGVDLQAATIADLQAALTAHRFTSVDLVDAFTARATALDDLELNRDVPRNPAPPLPDTAGHYVSLNSIRAINPHAREEAALRDAQRQAGTVLGPLHGIPVLLKDNIGTHDVPTTAGSIALATNLPTEDATLVKRLRETGAVILGKAELAEFANWMATGTMPNGYSSLGGQVMDAYTGQNPSGSSSGSAVAASMAFAAATVGSETSGSIIGPSSSNSVVGLKPTMGLVSRYGVVPLDANFDMTGPIVRNVADAAIMLSGMSQRAEGYIDPNDKETQNLGGHIAPGNDYTVFLRNDALEGVKIVHPQVSGSTNRNFTRALAVLRSLGATTENMTSNENTLTNAYLSEFGVVSNDFKNGINDYLVNVAGPNLPIDALAPDRRLRSLSQIIAYNQGNPDKIPYGQQNLILSDANPGDPVTVLAMGAAVRESNKAIADMILANHGAQAMVGFGLGFYGVGTAAGYPSLTVPAGYGLQGGRLVSPQSITFTGPAFSDGALLGYAYAFEQATHFRVRPEAQNQTLLASVCPGNSDQASTAGAGATGFHASDDDPMAALPRLPDGRRVPLL